MSGRSMAVLAGAAPPRAERVKVFCRVRPLLQRERDGWSYEEFAQQYGEQPEDRDGDPAIAAQQQRQYASPPEKESSSTTFLTEKGGKLALHSSVVAIHNDRKTLTYTAPGAESERKEFVFDASLGEDTPQDDVYQRVAYDIVHDVLDGYNGTILAYGQTSTGKTHTMLGQDDLLGGDARGIIPRAFEDIFDRAEATRTKAKTSVALSYVQIYCERVFDLLSPETPHGSILIREDPGRGVYLDGAATVAVSSVDECMRLVARGNANRAVASTSMNAHSSRSHAILIARIERKEYATANATAASQGKAAAAPTQQLKLSSLYLVDLAGSERVKKAKVVGRHVNELKAINLSLSALGNCISALSRQSTQPQAAQGAQRHVPYRDSKLTRLLQSSLGGNAKTSLVITVSPSPTEAPETLSTLLFGQRAMKVAVRAHQNVMSVLDYKALYEETQQQLDERTQHCQQLEIELAQRDEQRCAVEEQLTKAQLRIQHLEFECQAAKVHASNVSTATGTGKAGSSSTPRQSAGDASASGSNNGTALEQQLAGLVRQHEQDVAAIKTKCDLQVETYKRLAEEAQLEWHELEDALAGEKQQVLASLLELKEFKARFFQLEDETTDRIAELVQDETDRARDAKYEKELAAQRLQAHDKTIHELQQKLTQAEERNLQLQDQLEGEYIPRDTLKQMEALYEGAIAKLQSRVGSLEQKSTGSNRKLPLPSNQESTDDRAKGAAALPVPGGLPALVQQPHAPSGKAIPKIGRIVPGSRANTLR